MEPHSQPKDAESLSYEALNAERVFSEGLLQQRFNFFIVAFSLVMAAGTAAHSKSALMFVLIVGFVFCLLLGFCVYRIFVKVDAVLRMLHRMESGAMHQVAEAGIKRWPLSFRVNDIMGYVIPVFSPVVIVAWAVLAICGVIEIR
jgi:hypothetical protein